MINMIHWMEELAGRKAYIFFENGFTIDHAIGTLTRGIEKLTQMKEAQTAQMKTTNEAPQAASPSETPQLPPETT